MSTEALELFYKKIQEDSALEAEAAEAFGRGPGDVVALALKQGFDFSEDELATALSKYSSRRPSELSDADLDLVAGGTRSTIVGPGLGKDGARRS